MKSGFHMGNKTFERGIHPSYYKEFTAAKKIVDAALPKTVSIPLQQHAGAICEPLVKKGDAVEEGQKIGDAKAFICAPVHASISGRVRDIEPIQHPSGGKALSIIIEGDGSVKKWGAGRETEVESLTPVSIRESVREAGIVGMGGAAFPTYVKLAAPGGKTTETVLLNGCECEPYLTADQRLMLEEPEKVIDGLFILMKAAGARNGIIGIEENKPESIEAVKKALGGRPAVKITVLKTKYPQGAEKMLIKAALGRKVPPGKLPLDLGVLVNNVGTAFAVYEAVNYGKPLIERVITVSGNGVREPANMRVRIGTGFDEVLNQCGGITGGGWIEVLSGGPMMGVSQSDLNAPVVKGTSGITVIAAERLKTSYEACIKCARCVEACPMGLMPFRLGDYGRVRMTAEFRDWGGASCIECGCCSYVCPSKRPLLQWIRVGKAVARKETKVPV